MAKKSHKRSRSGKTSSKKYVGKVAKVYQSNKSSGMYRSSAGGYVEKKWNDIVFTAAQIGSGATTAYTVPKGATDRCSLAKIIQSATVNGRVGNKITVTNINWHGDLGTGYANFGANIPASTRIRLVLAWDLQSNGLDNNDSGARYATMFASNVAAGANVCNSYRNMDTLARYKIIKDKYFTLSFGGSVSTTVSCEAACGFRFAWKGKMVVHYKSSTSTTGSAVDMPSEDLVLLAISDSGDGNIDGSGTQGPNITSLCRVKYIDC